MRLLMILGGAALWLNAFACREEMVPAWISACEMFQQAMSAQEVMTVLQNLGSCGLAMFGATPIWKLLAGAVFFRLSIAPQFKSTTRAYSYSA